MQAEEGKSIQTCNASVQVSVLYSPVDERVPHAGGDGRGLRCVAESEDALNDGQLCAGGVQAAERAPVVDHHPCRDDLTAPVYCASLNRKSAFM